MAVILPTVTDQRDCDQRLTAVHAAYVSAVDTGDEATADAAYVLMDALLDLRIHLPLPRPPS